MTTAQKIDYHMSRALDWFKAAQRVTRRRNTFCMAMYETHKALAAKHERIADRIAKAA